MQCDICCRPPSSRLPFNCTLCARDALYQPRIQSAQLLLQNESLRTKVEHDAASPPTSNKDGVAKNSQASSTITNPTWNILQAGNQCVLADDKTQNILHRVHELRENIKSMKTEIAKRRTKLRKRAQEFASAQQELFIGQAKAIEPVGRGTRHTQLRWTTLHGKTIESRSFLCREAALLYGLQQRKRKKGEMGRDTIFIGGLSIVDLRDLNNASPTHVTTAITNLAHLVHLISHYLSLRLPAEITLPRRDYPLPTIFSPTSSYTGREVTFPSSTPSHSSGNSPSASRHGDHSPLPKPRPLFLDKKLSALAKDDTVAYASFIEGITFLAWDIAWLCRTQGMAVGETTWEDVCAMGKNLWQLLLEPSPKLAQSKEVSVHNPLLRPAISRSATPTNMNLTANHAPDSPRLGRFSHGTAYDYIITGPGAELMRTWKLQSSLKVIEKVKAMLLADRTGAEWEILEDKEWEEEQEARVERKEDELSANRLAIDETGILVKPNLASVVEGTVDRDRRGYEGKDRGQSGWMKLKNR